MTKSLALAFAAFAFSAASALASPLSAPNDGSVGGSLPQQSNVRIAETLPMAAAQSGSDSQTFWGYGRNAYATPSVNVPATPTPLRDSTLGLVNETGGGD